MADSSTELIDITVSIDGKEVQLQVSQDIYQKVVQKDQATLDLICASVGENSSKQQSSQDLSNVVHQEDSEQSCQDKGKVCACKGIRTCSLCESIGKESVVPIKVYDALVQEKSDSALQQLSEINAGDICIPSHQSEGGFDFLQGMTRLEMASKQGIASLKAAVVAENLLLPSQDLCDLPTHHELDIASMKDDLAVNLLENYSDTTYGTPIKTTANGNCLFNAVSILLFGNERKSVELRYRTLLMMINNEDTVLNHTDKSSIMLLSPDFNDAVLECAKLGGFSSIWTMIALSKLIDRPLQSIYPYVNGKDDLAYRTLNQTFNIDSSGDKISVMWTSTTKIPQDVVNGKKTWVPNHFVAVLPSHQVLPEVRLENALNPTLPEVHKDLPPTTPKVTLEGPQESASNSNNIMSELRSETSIEFSDVEQIGKESSRSRDSNSVNNLYNCVPVEGPCRGKLNKFLSIKQFMGVLENEKTGLSSVPEGAKDNMYFIVDNSQNLERNKFNSRFQFLDDCGGWEKGTSPTAYLLPVGETDEYVALIKRQGKFCIEMPQRQYQDIQPQPDYEDLLIINRYYTKLKADNSYRRKVSWVVNAPEGISVDISTDVAVYEYLGEFPRHLLPKNKKHAILNQPSFRTKSGGIANNEPDCENPCELSDAEQIKDDPRCVSLEGPCRGKLNKFLSINQLMDVLKSEKTGLASVPIGAKDNMYFVIDYTKNVEGIKDGHRFQHFDDCGQWEKSTSPSAYLLPCDDSHDTRECVSLIKRHGKFCIAMAQREYQELQPQPDLEDLLIISRYYSKLKADNSYQRKISWIVNVPDEISVDISPNVAVYEYMGEFPRHLLPSTKKHANTNQPSKKTKPRMCRKMISDIGGNESDCETPREVSDAEQNEESSESCDLNPLNVSSQVSVEGPCHGKITRFLSMHQLMDVLKNEETGLSSVPLGAKDNVYFIIDNSPNLERIKEGLRFQFWDDCGAWEKSTAPTTYLLPFEDTDEYISIIKRDGKFCVSMSRREYQEIQPQPDLEDLLIINRYYSKLKADNSYRRRISWIVNVPDAVSVVNANVAVYEYLGNFPCRLLHGNTKRANKNQPYIKTELSVHRKIIESVKHQSAKNVYDCLNQESDLHGVPRNLKQVQNLKYTEAKKLKTDTKSHTMALNLANHIIPTIMRLYIGHNFVRSIKHVYSGPSIILYTDQQINDMRRFCCCDQPAVIDVHKTYNLGEIYLTTVVFKNRSVVNSKSGEHPIFLGPAYLHGKSEFSAFNEFFGHLGSFFTDQEMRKMVVGSDNMCALKKSLMRCFPLATHLVCSRHLKSNVKDYLNQRVDVKEEDKYAVVNSIFGENGLTDTDDSILFQSRVDEITASINEKAPGFLKYFKSRIEPVLKKQVQIPLKLRPMDKDWTDTSSEYIDKLQEIGTNYKMEDLTNVIDFVDKIVKSMYEDLQEAIVGLGRYELAPSFKHQEISVDVWSQKTPEQKAEIMKRFTKDMGRSSNKKPLQRKWLMAEHADGCKRLKLST